MAKCGNNLIKNFVWFSPSMKMVSRSGSGSCCQTAAICVSILATRAWRFFFSRFLVKTRSQQVARNAAADAVAAVANCSNCCFSSCQGANWCVSSGILNEAIKIERLHSYTFGPAAPAHQSAPLGVTASPHPWTTAPLPSERVYLLIQSIFLTATRWHASIDHVNWNWVTWSTWHHSGIRNFHR